MRNKRKTILIVDDELKTCINLSKMLSLKGDYSVLTSSDGDHAIALISRAPEEIDILITDMYMPKVTGYDIISHIRKNKFNIDIIIISGGDRSIEGQSPEKDELLSMATKYGKTKFIKKPFETDDLILLIEEEENN